ncbi:MAG TPA: SMC-Scp complex subunit ScpB [Gammaproteobacteria bacterium]|nr:SMC-Scp complex subunit ScpB [Gammaproteobacteria bacterium]
MDQKQLVNIIEAALLATGGPLSIREIIKLFPEDAAPERKEIQQALSALGEACAERGIELKEVGSGFRLQIKQDFAPWVSKLWEERPPRYSRALLETLALVAYKQPITRAEIEEVRGVSVSSNIMKTLLDRGWVRVVGHRDVPGKPSLYATTNEFLDYFNLKGLSELPSLAEIRDIESINAELDLDQAGAPQAEGEGEDGAIPARAAQDEGEESAPQAETAREDEDEETREAAATSEVEVMAAPGDDSPAPIGEPRQAES